MKLDLFLVCDYAQDVNGKLSIIGTFDIINVTSLPAFHPILTLCCRIIFEGDEIKKHKFNITTTNKKGKKCIIDAEGELIPPKSLNKNLWKPTILGLYTNIKFEELGEYEIKLNIDDQLVDCTKIFVEKLK